MSNVSVQKVKGEEKGVLPIFAEINKRLDEVRRRAYELFRQRNSGVGLEVEDWLAAEREIFGWATSELSEKDNAYQLEITVAGFDPKEVNVTATPGEIVVHAENSTRELYRRFELARPLAFDNVTARLEKGILHITAPQAAQAKPAATVKNVKIAAA
jgi:HSP20 family molecular chaperone IbpA